MEIAVVQDKIKWNDYIQRHAKNDGGFLQSWEWGEFQKVYGRKVLRLAVRQNDEIAFGWQIIEMPLPLGLKYWYVPRPVWNQESVISNQEFFFKQIYNFAKKEKAIFVRVDATTHLIPPLVRGDEGGLKNYGFRKTNLSIQPKEEFIIDITKPQEQLLAEMKPKTRYNIRVAEKHGIIVSSEPQAQSPEFFDEFWNLIKKTSQRQGIHPHPKEYYQKMLEGLGKNGLAKLYTAQYQGKIIAANLITYFGKTATYLHGGTDDEFKNVMAPNLLQWQAICDAKKIGFECYNFGGVSNTKKSWEGITRFKTGFCPDTKFTEYGGVWDLPVNKFWYRAYKLSKNF